MSTRNLHIHGLFKLNITLVTSNQLLHKALTRKMTKHEAAVITELVGSTLALFCAAYYTIMSK